MTVRTLAIELELKLNLRVPDLPRQPFGFENRGHIAQDLVFAFRSPNHFFEAIWVQVKIGGPEQAPGPHPFHTPVPYPRSIPP